MIPAPQLSVNDRAQTVAAALEAKQGENISILDVAPIAALIERFVIVSGSNSRQVGALVDSVLDAMRDLDGSKPMIEGRDDATWVLLDYGDVVVHVFLRETRAYYDLDQLWASLNSKTVLLRYLYRQDQFSFLPPPSF